MGRQLPLGLEPRSDRSQWFTPAELAWRMVHWAGIGRGTHVLEPCAGAGALVAAALARGARVTAAELDGAWAEHVRRAYPAAEVHAGDFHGLVADGPLAGLRADVALANPPSERGEDVRCILTALRVARRAVALIRSPSLQTVGAYRGCWSHVRVTRVAMLVGRPRWNGQGGGREPWAVVECSVHDRPGQTTLPSLEWWDLRES